jgi:N-hydroxyarylamine O-acetyltransferase
MGNFYSSNHPNAVFINNFVISLILPNITLSLRNNIYHKIHTNKTEIIDIKNNMQLYSIINDDFNIPISEQKCNKLFQITNELLKNL